jgi:hypothetical protein
MIGPTLQRKLVKGNPGSQLLREAQHPHLKVVVFSADTNASFLVARALIHRFQLVRLLEEKVCFPRVQREQALVEPEGCWDFQ